MPAYVSFSSQIGACADFFREKAATQLDQHQLVPMHQSMAEVLVQKHTSLGARRMKRIIDLIDNVEGYELSIFQRVCLEEILQTIAPIVYGDDTQGLAVYFKKNGWRMTSCRQVFMETARRAGKTDLLTLVAAAMMMVIPDFEIITWSLYNRTAELFGATVYKWLLRLGATNVKKSKEHVHYHAAPGDVRRMQLIGGQNPDVSAGGLPPPLRPPSGPRLSFFFCSHSLPFPPRSLPPAPPVTVCLVVCHFLLRIVLF